ncbi:2-dehydro-3-deoxy-D-gluconate 5-dehydrogenase [Peptococcaceae bacterium CEB3]|nr:2-dehydro-3-deoxy-D-gluconate 5-dehydrogenase [Peptococcaceae bacterium CEB3]
MFTKNFALEMAPYGILANAIAPGGIITAGTSNLSADGAADEQMKAMLEKFARQIPLGRMGNLDDIGKVAVFLASQAADYMTGSLVVVDGGRLLA